MQISGQSALSILYILAAVNFANPVILDVCRFLTRSLIYSRSQQVNPRREIMINMENEFVFESAPGRSPLFFYDVFDRIFAPLIP